MAHAQATNVSPSTQANNTTETANTTARLHELHTACLSAGCRAGALGPPADTVNAMVKGAMMGRAFLISQVLFSY